MPICSKSQVAAGRWEGHEPRFFVILVNVLAGVAGTSESRAGSDCSCGRLRPVVRGKRSEAKQSAATT